MNCFDELWKVINFFLNYFRQNNFSFWPTTIYWALAWKGWWKKKIWKLRGIHKMSDKLPGLNTQLSTTQLVWFWWFESFDCGHCINTLDAQLEHQGACCPLWLLKLSLQWSCYHKWEFLLLQCDKKSPCWINILELHCGVYIGILNTLFFNKFSPRGSSSWLISSSLNDWCGNWHVLNLQHPSVDLSGQPWTSDDLGPVVLVVL